MWPVGSCCSGPERKTGPGSLGSCRTIPQRRPGGSGGTFARIAPLTSVATETVFARLPSGKSQSISAVICVAGGVVPGGHSVMSTGIATGAAVAPPAVARSPAASASTAKSRVIFIGAMPG